MTLPVSASGVSPVERAIRKNSHAARAAVMARSAASGAPPYSTIATATGAARTPKAIRLVSSELKRCSDLHDLGLFRLDQLVDLVDVIVMELLQILLGMLDVVL